MPLIKREDDFENWLIIAVTKSFFLQNSVFSAIIYVLTFSDFSKGVVNMCKDKKRCRQILQLVSAIIGLVAAVMYFWEMRKELSG